MSLLRVGRLQFSFPDVDKWRLPEINVHHIHYQRGTGAGQRPSYICGLLVSPLLLSLSDDSCLQTSFSACIRGNHPLRLQGNQSLKFRWSKRRFAWPADPDLTAVEPGPVRPRWPNIQPQLCSSRVDSYERKWIEKCSKSSWKSK